MTKDATSLPTNVKEADLKYPSRERVTHTLYCALVKFSPTSSRWVVRTLGISNANWRNREYGVRSYAIGVDDQKVYRVGKGPHLLRDITVYVHEGNAARLKALVALNEQGAEKAGIIRDRISTRRARGQLMRAEGRSRWTW